MIKKFNEYIKESLRDKMTPKSEEDIKKSMGENRYNNYKKLSILKDKIDKRPFYTSPIKLTNNLSLTIEAELSYFEIHIINNMYSMEIGSSIYKTKNVDELINKIIEKSKNDLIVHKSYKLKEINILKEEIKNYEEEYSYLDKNF